MRDLEQNSSTLFGGAWTLEKLGILESYLDAYTTALKSQPFKLLYIDAFAGTGRIVVPSDEDDNEIRHFVSGSVERAVSIKDKPFDRLIFVEEDSRRCARLEEVRATNPGRNISIENSDANKFLSNLNEDWCRWRGVLFLDPFATDVEWSTIQTIAAFNALDTWILFPVSAIARMLPRSKQPDDISVQWVKRLELVFRDESWRELYRNSPQPTLFGDTDQERDPGVGGLLEVYKDKLGRLFGDRLLTQSRTLKNSKKSPLFEFLFCVGNPRGKQVATNIATHILERL